MQKTKSKPIRTCFFALLSACVLFTSCQNNDGDYGIFRVGEDNTVVIVDGEVGDNSLRDFEDIIADYPSLTVIEFHACPGSFNDNVNLQLGRLAYNRGFDTRLIDGGLIASGGVDFFLAGVRRSLGQDVMVGVHSWASGDQEAIDFPDNVINFHLSTFGRGFRKYFTDRIGQVVLVLSGLGHHDAQFAFSRDLSFGFRQKSWGQ